jgi:hypothetical protein
MLNILIEFEFFHSRIKIYLTFNVEVRMKCNINLLFWFYLLPTFIKLKFFKKIIQLIKTWWKHGGFHNETLKEIWTYFLMFMLKNCHIKYLDLGGRTFWSILPCLDPLLYTFLAIHSIINEGMRFCTIENLVYHYRTTFFGWEMLENVWWSSDIF